MDVETETLPSGDIAVRLNGQLVYAGPRLMARPRRYRHLDDRVAPLYEEAIIRSLVNECATAREALRRAANIARRHEMGETLVDEFERAQDRVDLTRQVLRDLTEERTC